MSNQDVKGFFDTYDPHYKLEWVNDLACEYQVWSVWVCMGDCQFELVEPKIIWVDANLRGSCLNCISRYL